MRNRFKNKWYGKQGKLGFTLIEVLVAIAILALLAIPLAQSMITSAQINSQSKNIGSASDMAQTVAESMQATQLGNVLTEINGYTTNSVGYELFNTTTGEGYSFLNNALQGYSVEDSYEVMLLCPGCNARLSNAEIEAGACDCGNVVNDNNIKYVPVRKQNDVGVQSDADVTSSIKTRTTTDNIVRTYFTGNADDTYDFVLKNIHTEEANFDVLVHVEPEQTLKIADISSMSSSDLVNIVEKKNLDEDVAETFFQSHQMYCSLRHTSTTMTVQDFQNQMTRQITIDIRNDAIRGTTVITVKAVYTAPEGTVDVADKYISKTVGSFTTNSTAELADGVYLYYYPMRGNSRDVIIVNNPDSMAIKVYLILMNDEQTGEYNPALKFSDLTPANAANTTTFCSNHPEDKFAELPTGVHIKTLSNTTEQQTLYSMDVKVFTHKDSSFDTDGVFTPDKKYLLVDTDATLLDSSERFDVNVDTEFGNPIPEEPEGGEPGDDPGDGDDDIEIAPNRGYSEAGGQNFVYSGDEYDVTKIGGGPTDPDAGKFVEWSGQTKATDAGVYYAYAKPTPGHTWPNGTTGKRQVTWTIARKPAAIIETQNAVYDAQEHLGYNPDTTKTNYVSMTGDVARTDAGHYTIYVTPDPNYAWLDDGSYGTREVTWTISPCPITLTWKTGEGFDIWQYDGDPHSGVCEVGGLQGNDTPETVKPNIRDNRIIEVGKVTAKVTSLSNPNYALPTQGTTHDLTVWGAKQAEIVMKPANNGVVSMIYNGKEQTGVEFSVGVAITGTTHAIDAGTYTIIATPLPGYAWDAAGNDRAPRDFDWQILQRDVDIVWGDRVWDYDGIVHSTTCTITNLLPDTVCDVEISNNFILDAGSKEVEATLTNKNYRIPDTTNPEKKPIQTLIVNTLPDSTFTVNEPVIYDKQTHTWGTGSHIQISGTLSETEAGKYQVTIVPTKNHTWTDGTTTPVTKTWEIKSAELSKVDWDNYSYTGDFIIGVTNQFCDWGDGDWRAKEKGTYTIDVTPSKNYAWADDPNEVVYDYRPQDRSTRTYTWKIVGNTVVKPDPDKALLNFGDPILVFEYSGIEVSPHVSTVDGTLPLTDPVFMRNPYYTVTGETSAIEACKGNCNGDCANPYVAVISLKDKARTEWASGGTDDIIIKWHITKRKITLYTIPHEGTETWYENNKYEGSNRSLTGLTAYKKTHNASPFSLKLNLATSAIVKNGEVTSSSGDGDIWLTKDNKIKYSFDYKPPIEETSPLAANHTIKFDANPSPNIMNTEAADYAPNFDPIAKTGIPANTLTCAQQTTAGVYWYCVTPHIYAKNQEVTENYDITFKFSYLMIDKREYTDKDWTAIEVDLDPNASVYKGIDQALVSVLKAPDWGTLEYLWEGYTYKAENAWVSGGTPTPTLSTKKSLLPQQSAWPDFHGTGFDGSTVAKPGAIEYLQGYIDWSSITPGDGGTGVVRGDCPYWTATIPTAAKESNGTVFSEIGTYAGEYVVYFRIHGDKNHGDYWDPSMYIVLTVDRSNQTFKVLDKYDKCYNKVSQDIRTTAQENPVISYGSSEYVTPNKNNPTNIATTVGNHTKAKATQTITTLTSKGKIGDNQTLAVRAAATENYNQANLNIQVACRDHLKSDVVRDELNHLCSGACEQYAHAKHSNKTYAPTCESNGNYHYDCLECGNERNVVRNATGHNWVSSYSAPSLCVNGGHTSTYCTRCGAGSSTYLPPRYPNHTWKYRNIGQHYCKNVASTETKTYIIITETTIYIVKVTIKYVCGLTVGHNASMQTGNCCGQRLPCGCEGNPYRNGSLYSHFHRGAYTPTSKTYCGGGHYVITTYTKCSCCGKTIYSNSKYV